MFLPLSEVCYLLFMLWQPKPSWPIPVKCSTERKSPLHVVWGPRSDHQRSPRRLHVPACCIVGGMDWSKHNNARGPFEELSCSSHYKDSTLCFPLYGPIFTHIKFTIPLTNSGHRPKITLFLIQFDLLTWMSTGHRPDFSLASQLITHT